MFTCHTELTSTPSYFPIPSSCFTPRAFIGRAALQCIYFLVVCFFPSLCAISTGITLIASSFLSSSPSSSPGPDPLGLLLTGTFWLYYLWSRISFQIVIVMTDNAVHHCHHHHDDYHIRISSFASLCDRLPFCPTRPPSTRHVLCRSSLWVRSVHVSKYVYLNNTYIALLIRFTSIHSSSVSIFLSARIWNLP